MKTLAELFRTSEDFLVDRILLYATRFGFLEYTSSLAGAWRISISSLTKSLREYAERHSQVPDLLPDTVYSDNPAVAFGVETARKHRARGIEPAMFLALLKHFRQAYLDLIAQENLEPERERLLRSHLNRFFDLVELGIFEDWARAGEGEKLSELMDANRTLTREKVRALAVLESLPEPIMLLDPAKGMDLSNRAFQSLFGNRQEAASGEEHAENLEKLLKVLLAEMRILEAAGDLESHIVKTMNTNLGPRKLRMRIQSIQDVGKKFSGCVVTFSDPDSPEKGS